MLLLCSVHAPLAEAQNVSVQNKIRGFSTNVLREKDIKNAYTEGALRKKVANISADVHRWLAS
jgi:hypothetical protein